MGGAVSVAYFVQKAKKAEVAGITVEFVFVDDLCEENFVENLNGDRNFAAGIGCVVLAAAEGQSDEYSVDKLYSDV